MCSATLTFLLPFWCVNSLFIITLMMVIGAFCAQELYEMLVDELHKQIYVKSVSGVVKGFQRHGSQRQSGGKKDKTSLVKQVLTGTAADEIQGTISWSFLADFPSCRQRVGSSFLLRLKIWLLCCPFQILSCRV